MLSSLKITAQSNQPISKYDDEYMRLITLPELIKRFENSLLIISDIGSDQLDCKNTIGNLLYSNTSPRVFFNDQVRIENDLIFDAKSNPVKDDEEIKDYLQSFLLLYNKTDKPTISFDKIEISALKLSTYFYYNVSFRSTFKNKDLYGNVYLPALRVAEIRLEYDTAWNAYINSIRFAESSFNLKNTKNNFADFSEVYDQSTEAKQEKINLKKSEQEAQQIRVNQIIVAGDKYYLAENFHEAFNTYKSAWAYDPYNDELIRKIDDCENKIQKAAEIKRLDEQRNNHIQKIKETVLEEFRYYNFNICKLYYDSLVNDYNYSGQDLNYLSEKLSEIISFISKVKVLEENSNYYGIMELCSGILKTQKKKGLVRDSILTAEIYYRGAHALYSTDSAQYSDISDYLETTLSFSGKKHFEASKLLIRSKLYSKTNQLRALEIANDLVNEHPRNPIVRVLRADVNAYFKKYSAAISDYEAAINLRTNDVMVYVNKSRLEYLIEDYLASISTSNSALKAFLCNSHVHYWRILAEEKAEMYYVAGVDYQRALNCNLLPIHNDSILAHCENYYNIGLWNFENNKLDSAIKYLNRSFNLCRNLASLFFKGYSNYKIGKYASALNDIDTLTTLDSLFKYAYYVRGITLSAQGNHASAIRNFNIEIAHNPNHLESYIACGNSHFELKNFPLASKLFIKAIALNYSVDIAEKVIESLYMAGDYSHAIELAHEYNRTYKTKSAILLKFQGMSIYMSKDFTNALYVLLNASKQIPEDYAVSIFLAKTYIALGKGGNAYKYAEHACTLNPQSSEALLLSGMSIISQQKKKGNEEGSKFITIVRLKFKERAG